MRIVANAVRKTASSPPPGWCRVINRSVVTQGRRTSATHSGTWRSPRALCATDTAATRSATCGKCVPGNSSITCTGACSQRVRAVDHSLDKVLDHQHTLNAPSKPSRQLERGHLGRRPRCYRPVSCVCRTALVTFRAETSTHELVRCAHLHVRHVLHALYHKRRFRSGVHPHLLVVRHVSQLAGVLQPRETAVSGSQQTRRRAQPSMSRFGTACCHGALRPGGVGRTMKVSGRQQVIAPPNSCLSVIVTPSSTAACPARRDDRS
jgi:hypothetical protein